MRKFTYLLTLALLLTAGKMSAQSFTMQYDTVTVVANGYSDVYNYINNTSSDTISVKWKILSHTLPQTWKDSAAFGLCDNVTCYDDAILPGTTTLTTDTFGAGKKCLFKMQINVTSMAVTPTGATPVYVRAELWHGSTRDTVTFAIIKWNNTNVGKLNTAKDDVVLYPNPAYDDLNVTFSKDMEVKTIAIYNLVGKQVSVYKTNGTSARLDIAKIPSGIYFLRLMDNAGRTVSTRRFTHQ